MTLASERAKRPDSVETAERSRSDAWLLRMAADHFVPVSSVHVARVKARDDRVSRRDDFSRVKFFGMCPCRAFAIVASPARSFAVFS
jgi:hypothetical protein